MSTSFLRRRPPVAVLIGVAVLLLAVVVVGGVILLQRVYAAPPQPLIFEHSTHVNAGVSCLFCHAGAARGAVAGIPSMAKCMGCHSTVVPKDPADQADIDRLVAQWESQTAIQWVKIVDEPDFVRFNHRPHIQAGVACESCHGDVSSMSYAQEPYNLNMGFCLSCHRKQDPAVVARLVDCATCHY